MLDFVGMWYRAEVIGPVSADSARLLFIDFGNSSDVSLSKIQPLDESFAGIHRLALCCCLAKDSVKQWKEEAVQVRSDRSIITNYLNDTLEIYI